jgi:hypothetical protein
MTTKLTTLFALVGACLLSACSTYQTPGAKCQMSTFSDPAVKKAYTARPAIKFPANLAIVRVQESGYKSETASGVGSGAYSVVTAKDIETEKDFNKIAALPGVAGVARLNKLLLPTKLNSDLDLREAAAKLQTDAILVYTFDTALESKQAVPAATVLSLGLLSNTKYKFTSSALALLMDTKTGFIYGTLEEDSTRSGVNIDVINPQALDKVRKQAEREAFDKLLAEFEPFWSRIQKRYR